MGLGETHFAENFHDGLEGSAGIERIHVFGDDEGEILESAAVVNGFSFVEPGAGLHGAANAPASAAHDAGQEIAEGGLQVVLVDFDDEGVVVAGVVVDAPPQSEEEAHRVDAESFQGEEGIDHVAGGLGHFCAAERPVGMGEYLAGEGKV